MRFSTFCKVWLVLLRHVFFYCYNQSERTKRFSEQKTTTVKYKHNLEKFVVKLLFDHLVKKVLWMNLINIHCWLYFDQMHSVFVSTGWLFQTQGRMTAGDVLSDCTPKNHVNILNKMINMINNEHSSYDNIML